MNKPVHMIFLSLEKFRSEELFLVGAPIQPAIPISPRLTVPSMHGTILSMRTQFLDPFILVHCIN